MNVAQRLEFRIDWGYLFLYSRRHYHPEYCWDGHLECGGGRIQSVAKLRYPVLWFGPANSPELTPLAGTTWQDRTRRGISGIAVVAEIDSPDALFTLVTASGSWQFSARRILEEGRVVFPVGAGYSPCTLIVTRRDFLWFRPPVPAGAQAWEGRQLTGLEQLDRCRMPLARLLPGESVEFTLDLPAAPDQGRHLLAHLQAMPEGQAEEWRDPATLFGTDDPAVAAEICVDDCMPLEWRDEAGRVLAVSRHYFRFHDVWVQLLEDVWSEMKLPEGCRRIFLHNAHPRLPLLISRIVLQWQSRAHLQLSLPAWLLKGEVFTARVFSHGTVEAVAEFDGRELPLLLQAGWNDFPLLFQAAGLRRTVTIRDAACAVASGVVEAVWDVADEACEIKVGADFTTVPHDDSGELLWILDYMRRTRLGNYAALRAFRGFVMEDSHIPAAELVRWGEFCRRHRMYLQATNAYGTPLLGECAGEFMHNAGPHEYSGRVYAFEPDDQSVDMADAARRFVEHLAQPAAAIRALGMPPGLGDGSGGQRYAYQAGFEVIRTETMVAHTMHLCSIARAAAQAYGKLEWGVHIAMQHAKQPYLENHLGQYYLSLMQPWAMGASFFYEEDSLFLQFKEERQCWDDALTRGKREMTREFFRFAKTHPRRGVARPRLAYLDGRYAAPFNGFVCGPEQDPDYAVWGLFGRSEAAWGHRQPEKARQLLDVWMPGASTHPLRQDFARRRFFFSGTPYGDFDQLPIEAPEALWQPYRLLVNFGWNTLIAEDMAKMERFVAAGGVLASGIPQFSTSRSRDIVEHPETMPLWHDGDWAEWAGVRITGAGEEFSGQWRWEIPGFDAMPRLSGIPSRAPEEDGGCRVARLELAGAEVVCRDAVTGEALIVRKRHGAGYFWLMTVLAWPGHEKLQPLAAQWLAGLSEQAQEAIRVEDPSGEVFWSVRETAEESVLTLLNTAWHEPGSCRKVRVTAPCGSWECEVIEREAKLIHIFDGYAVESIGAAIPHLELGDGEVVVHADRPVTLAVHRGNAVHRVECTPDDSGICRMKL